MTNVSPVRVIAVTGGKGGVGKTSISVNLSIALAGMGKNIMLMDADLGLANVDVMLGLQPKKDLSQLFNGECTLDEVVVSGPDGVLIVPGSSGMAHLANLSNAEHMGLIQAFSELTRPVDVLMVDTAAGISQTVTNFSRAAQDVLVVVCDEPASITDAYAIIKVLSRDHGVDHFHIVANMVRSSEEGQRLYRKLAAVSDRFLDVVLRYMGAVPQDEEMRRAIQRQNSVVKAAPFSASAKALRSMATGILGWPSRQGPSGSVEFFVERLLAHNTRSLESAI
jgi:flagellar biosynthesis protein FlhG